MEVSRNFGFLSQSLPVYVYAHIFNDKLSTCGIHRWSETNPNLIVFRNETTLRTFPARQFFAGKLLHPLLLHLLSTVSLSLCLSLLFYHSRVKIPIYVLSSFYRSLLLTLNNLNNEFCFVLPSKRGRYSEDYISSAPCSATFYRSLILSLKNDKCASK